MNLLNVKEREMKIVVHNATPAMDSGYRPPDVVAILHLEITDPREKHQAADTALRNLPVWPSLARELGISGSLGLDRRYTKQTAEEEADWNGSLENSDLPGYLGYLNDRAECGEDILEKAARLREAIAAGMVAMIDITPPVPKGNELFWETRRRAAVLVNHDGTRGMVWYGFPDRVLTDEEAEGIAWRDAGGIPDVD